MKKKLNSAVMVAVLGALHSTADAGIQVELIEDQCNKDLEKAARSSVNNYEVMHVLERSAAQFASSFPEIGNTILQPGLMLAYNDDSTDLSAAIQAQDLNDDLCYNNCVCVCYTDTCHTTCFDIGGE